MYKTYCDSSLYANHINLEPMERIHASYRSLRLFASTGYQPFGVGICTNTSTFRMLVPIPVPAMLSDNNPSVVYTGKFYVNVPNLNNNGNKFPITSFAIHSRNGTAIVIQATVETANLPTNYIGAIIADNDSTSSLELIFSHNGKENSK